MAPKNRHPRKPKAANKVTFEPEENDMEPEAGSGEEGEDPAAGGGEQRAKKDEEEFSLDEVLRLGGTQADYVLLAGLNDSNELVDGGKKGAIDDLEEGELEKFITKLGIRAFAGQHIISDEPEGENTKDSGKKETKKAKDKKALAEEQVSSAEQKVSKDKAVEDKQKVKKAKDLQVPAGKKPKQKVNVFEFQQRRILLIKPGGKWFDMEYAAEGSSTAQDPQLVSQYKALAQRLFEAEVELYRSKKNLQKGANSAWMKTVVSSGVLADRMAAMTVLIQDAPVHSLEHVENLVIMVKKKGSRRMGLMALDTLRELLLSDLLPEDRKLRSFTQHPFDKLEEKASGNRDARDRRLVLWYFEHLLKHHVAEFVTALDSVGHDTVATSKAKALATAHELLCNRPEQERALLIQVVNKLGDPEYKTAAKASYLLEMLLHKHPNMKAVVCCEVERLMFRPNISPKAQYYAVCFLSQVMLSHDEAELASKLITIYFSFFRACIKKKDIESKMLSALLSGVNRAYPYASAGDEKVKEQLDTLFKVVHLVKFNTAVQALMLLFQVMDSQQSISDRYYVALYRKLLDPGLSLSSRQSMFLNLLYKSLKADIVLRRVKAFVKRLLQVSAEQNASFACGALFLVSEVMKAKPALKMLLLDEGDGEEEDFRDLAEEEEDDEDEVERFVDADKLEEGGSVEAKETKPTASWVHHQNLEGMNSAQSYDPLHRNPLFCGADHTTLWELQRLARHFHPSVSLFAKTILQGEFILYSGDPLQDFTLIRFLDRFVFRNPKQLKGKQNTDAAALQPRQRLPVNQVSRLPVNCEEFLAKEENQIPVDEIFFYRFFKKRQQEKQSRRPRQDGDSESVQDVDDDEFEKILDSYEGDSYFTEIDDDDLDFAGNVKSKKGKKAAAEVADSDLDNSDVDDLDDEEVSLGSMDEEDFGNELEEEGGMFMDPDGGEEEFNDDDEVPELEEDDDVAFADSDDDMEATDVSPRAKKGKRKSSEELDFSGSLGSKQGKKKKKGKTDAAMFASAEEFGSLLDENAGSKFDNIGVNAMANTDKAGLKQLKWEAQRDNWIQGRDAKTLRQKKATFNRKKMFGRARTFGNKKRKK
ncbi:CCAAT/enhancer-binding protein zeta CCAAT-box-binding transcription factor [Channa argus]|uniref:CCAAT/enhancer-binding protein zeta n=1 Tax=Channa argus TaxID=215402 RepID=A0A6G1QLU3_CHAAH|nr:CCAAT/enhancer-binding protein zeta CCAAT-box-binding transcription factor [Channa argus]